MTNTKILAQVLTFPNDSSGGTTIQGPINTTSIFSGSTLGSIINRVLPFIIAFAGVGLLLVIIGGGFTLLTSAGDAKKMDAGKQQITNGLIGFIIIIVAYWLVQIAGTILGIGKIGDTFK